MAALRRCARWHHLQLIHPLSIHSLSLAWRGPHDSAIQTLASLVCHAHAAVIGIATAKGERTLPARLVRCGATAAGPGLKELRHLGGRLAWRALLVALEEEGVVRGGLEELDLCHLHALPITCLLLHWFLTILHDGPKLSMSADYARRRLLESIQPDALTHQSSAV